MRNGARASDGPGSAAGVVTVASNDILDLARGVLGDLDLEHVPERVLESARELAGARYAAIGVLDESRTASARFITTGLMSQPTGRSNRRRQGVVCSAS